MQGDVGLLIISLLQIYQGIFQRKFFRRLVKISENLRPRVCDLTFLPVLYVGGSVAEWLACWTQAHKGPGSNRSRDAVG